MSRMLLDDHFEFRGGATHGGERFGVRPRVQSAKVVLAIYLLKQDVMRVSRAAEAEMAPLLTGQPASGALTRTL
jgi:hypothetical protein